ncbi:unnamed protein product [Closterium sp. NIES-54]
MAVGYNNVNVNAATRHGISIGNMILPLRILLISPLPLPLPYAPPSPGRVDGDNGGACGVADSGSGAARGGGGLLHMRGQVRRLAAHHASNGGGEGGEEGVRLHSM